MYIDTSVLIDRYIYIYIYFLYIENNNRYNNIIILHILHTKLIILYYIIYEILFV